jgi:hypothetical protein
MALIRRNTSRKRIEMAHDPGRLRAAILALAGARLATRTLFATAFGFASPAMTPSRFFITR